MKKIPHSPFLFAAAVAASVLTACSSNPSAQEAPASDTSKPVANEKKYLSQPLLSNIYTADPSAHVFNNRIYVYPSHDTATGTPEDDIGSHFDMRDYHILSMDSVAPGITIR